MKMRFLPLLLITSFAFAQESVEQPVEPIITDLDRLVESVKKTASSRSAEDNARLQRFLADKNRQQYLLNQMKAKLNAEEDRSVRLTKEYEDNDARLADLEEQLTLKLGSFGELFGIVRQTAGESKGQFSLSLTNIEYPERIEFLGDIAERKSLDLPTNEELERLWFEILNELNQSGKVKEYSTQILSKSGEVVDADILRMGVFNSVADGMYLNLIAEQNVLEYLPKQPDGGIRRSAKRLQNSDSGTYHEVYIDPTRGSLLTKLIDRAGFFERINQGGFVGYIIILLFVIGIVLGAMRYRFLTAESKVLDAELVSGNFSENSVLGKLNRIFKDYKGSTPEDLEAQLEDVLSRAVPVLEQNLSTIKLLAAVAPLLGLLGTVVGMIETFQSITLFGTGDPKLMAGGISQALVTTVLGLLVAIPTTLLHSFTASSAKGIISVLEEQSTGILAERAETK